MLGGLLLLLIVFGAFRVLAGGFGRRQLSRWVGRAVVGLLALALAPALLGAFFSALSPSQRALLSAVGLLIVGLILARFLFGNEWMRRRHAPHRNHRRRPALPYRRPALQALGPPPAYRALQAAVQDGRIRPGYDLYDGSQLPMVSASQGHYTSPQNYQNALVRMDSDPWNCDWCGRRLPAQFVAEHFRPHDHANDIRHHFHPECFEARNRAIRVIRSGQGGSESFELESIHIERRRWQRRSG